MPTIKKHLKTYLFRYAHDTAWPNLFIYFISFVILFIILLYKLYISVLFSGLEVTCRIRRFINWHVTYIHTYIHSKGAYNCAKARRLSYANNSIDGSRVRPVDVCKNNKGRVWFSALKGYFYSFLHQCIDAITNSACRLQVACRHSAIGILIGLRALLI